MGITLSDVQTLQNKGILSGKTQSLLDVGSSNLYNASKEGLLDFFEAYGIGNTPKALALAEKLSIGSFYDTSSGGRNEAFAGELFEHVGIRYEAIDIAKGYRTTILDLNHQSAPAAFVKAFDVVLNFGTTEHLLNQFNAFKVLHDSTRVGGFIVHSLPCVGYSNHGYFTYTPRCMFDIAGYNEYEVVDFWFSGPGADNDLFQPLKDYTSYFPPLKESIEAMQSREIGEYLTSIHLRDISLQVIFRKVHDRPFAGALEMTTSVGKVSSVVTKLYTGANWGDTSRVVERGQSNGGRLTKLFKKFMREG